MHFRHLLLSASLAASLVAGCSVDDEDPQEEQTLPERRHKIGKADLWGSCDGPGNSVHCGHKSQGNCWCDKACTEFGDCCADYQDTCGSQCSPIMCTLFCAYGFKKGPDGCEVCSCVQPEQCGGFANFQCPAGKTCIDDPTDSCDPQNGGADCGGICVEPSPCLNAGGTCHNGLALCGPGTTASSLECSNTSIEQTCCVPDDATPSCQGLCGGAAPGKVCYCDSLCTQYGDCCADYASVCGTERTPASGPCVKNSNEACTTDADCATGGCGGELCYNPAFGGGISTCECAGPGAPVQGCGCVNNKCTWYN